jgi:peptidoglycan L-alanyl-D-glutamate endopeptidase CwlK
MPAFGSASLRQLATCDVRLQQLFQDVVLFWDCQVLEGKRSEAQQRINVANGVSKTLDSKHVYPLGMPSLAVDVAPYPVKWNDLPRFYAFGGFVIGTARKMGVTLRWGGDWDSDRDFSDQRFNDLPHFELVDG